MPTPENQGQLVYVPPAALHTCAPPTKPMHGFFTAPGVTALTADAPAPGAMWRCGTCRRLWTASAARNRMLWRRATWRERLKAALFSHRGADQQQGARGAG